MFYADSIGVSDVYAQIAKLHSLHGHYWQPAPLLEQLAKRNSSFASWDADRSKQRPA